MFLFILGFVLFIQHPLLGDGFSLNLVFDGFINIYDAP